MPEWLKIILGGTFITGLVAFIGQLLGFRYGKKKNDADVKKVEQEIQSDSVKTAIDVTNLMLTRLTQAEQRLTSVEEENDKLRVIIASLRGTISDTKAQMKELMDDLTHCLKNKDCDEELKQIREKYGLND